MSKLSRRETLARGGQVVAAAAVLSTLPTIAQAKEDAELFALYGEYRRLERGFETAQERLSAVSSPVHQRHKERWIAGPLKRYSWCRGMGSRQEDAHLQCVKDARAEADRIQEEWDAKLAEAEERAGVPALQKKERAAADAWLGTLNRFIAMEANTPAGMILKFRIAWCDVQERRWQQTHSDDDLEFWPDAMASVLRDLERLAGRRI